MEFSSCRYREGIGNLPRVGVYCGQQEEILERRQKTRTGADLSAVPVQSGSATQVNRFSRAVSQMATMTGCLTFLSSEIA